MPRHLLDDKLVNKLAKKLRKEPESISKMVSATARKHALPAQGALVVLAQRNGIGTATFQRKLDAQTNSRIQTELTSSSLAPRQVGRKQQSGPRPRRGADEKAIWTGAIHALVQDPMLQERCGDLLRGRSSFDRVINQATQVLEHRTRQKFDPKSRLTGENLVGFAFKDEIAKSPLVVSGGDSDHQRGFTQILRGMVPAFRTLRIITSLIPLLGKTPCAFVGLLTFCCASSMDLRRRQERRKRRLGRSRHLTDC